MPHLRVAFSRLSARVLMLALVATVLPLLQLGLPGSAAHAQGSPTWYLEDIRAFVPEGGHPDFVAAGSVSYQVVRASVNGGQVDVAADGGKAYPLFCPGGTEHFSFKWNFLADASQFQLGSKIPVAMSAPTSTRTGACRGGPIANQAYIGVLGTNGNLIPTERSLSGASTIDGDVTYQTGAALPAIGQTGVSGTQTVNIESRLIGYETERPRAIFTIDITVNDVDIYVVYVYKNGLTVAGPPVPPTLSGAVAGANTLRFSWPDVPGADGYWTYTAYLQGGAWQYLPLQWVWAGYSLIINGASRGTRYCVTAVSRTAAGYSGWSNWSCLNY
jgi:hypothetical protein